MIIEDSQILAEMRGAIQSFLLGEMDAGCLADRLLSLRDLLQFSDPAWFGELTQHIATMDSASTFRPQNDVEAEQLTKATTDATTRLLDLLKLKNEQLH